MARITVGKCIDKKKKSEANPKAEIISFNKEKSKTNCNKHNVEGSVYFTEVFNQKVLQDDYFAKIVVSLDVKYHTSTRK